MSGTRRHGGRGDDPGQLRFEWRTKSGGGPIAAASPLPASVTPLVQCLPWDFQSTFPQPTPEAIDAGVISDEDATPERVRSIHEEHAREALNVLNELDKLLDARRGGVDPRNGKAPMLKEARERLQKFFETEPVRLERWWQSLMDTYEQAFGPEAADAFGKALRARHASIPVIAGKPKAQAPTPAALTQEKPPRQPVRRRRSVVARLPVPRPLPSAVAAGHFGQKENGKPVRPGAHEVREITERHAEKLIELLDSLASGPANGEDALQAKFNEGIAAYAEDFGQHAAYQLEAYVLRQASLDSSSRRGR